jgi:CBS domain-containing protein
MGRKNHGSVAAFMQTDIVTVTEGTSLGEVGQLLLERRVSGVPVVDRLNRPVGIVSLTDIVDSTVNENRQFGDEKLYYRSMSRAADGVRRGFHVDSSLDAAETVMTPLVLRIEAGASIVLAARVMARERVHRLIVVEGEKMVGIVTSMDIVRAVAEGRVDCRVASNEKERGTKKGKVKEK